MAIGIVALFAGLALVAPPYVSPADLTVNGIHNFRPERDSQVYFGSGAVAVVAALLLSLLAAGRRQRVARPRHARLVALGVAGAATASAVGAYVRVRHSLPLDSAERGGHLGLSLALVAACVVAAWAVRPEEGTRPAPAPLAARVRPGWADLVVPLLVVGLLYVPGWRGLAGNAFQGEGSLHLDFFGFGPATAFRTGAALGTELHPYYGLGWAMVFARLDPLSYGHIIRFEVVYGCLYFTGVYVLLRLLAGDRRWAAAGTALAILFQLFAGYPDAFVLWRFPSATVMRWSFDVWFFLACLLHLRTGRTAWAMVAGAMVALAVVFQVDTGLALAVPFALFWACLWRTTGARSVRVIAASATSAAVVVVVGLGMASRWTLGSGRFWRGWLENLRLSSAGGTLLPMATTPATSDIVVFAVATAVYLAVVCIAVLRVVRGRASTATVMLGCIAAYGFVSFSYFTGRSNPHNLFRPTVPLAILLGACGGLAHRAWVAGRLPSPARSAAAWGAPAVAVALLVANPGARAYPGLLHTAAAGGTARGVCLFEDPDDVCGMAATQRKPVRDLHAVAARLRSLGAAGSTVAVVDQIGPVIPHMAGARPWGRYVPLFPSLLTRAQVEVVAGDLRDNPPHFLVMRSEADVAPFYADIWHALRGTVEAGFVVDGREGPFEIWRRRAGN